MSNLESSEEIETKLSGKTLYTLEIAGAAIFSALSIVVSVFITPIIPRIPGWGIAIVDPISIIWITCLLIFGVRSGILCTAIGTIGLMPFDPTGWIGPMMKFTATMSLIIVPIIFLKLYKKDKDERRSLKLKEPKNFTLYGIIGTVLRIGVMVGFNIVLFLTLWAGWLAGTSLEFLGLPHISGWSALIIGAILINAWQSLLDLLIPYVIVFVTKLNEKFEIW
jgi:riboflavin transporter FmnP